MYRFFTASMCRWHCLAHSIHFTVMKLPCFLLLLIACFLTTGAHAQKISITAKDAMFADLIPRIQKQSGYDFVYNSSVLKAGKPITLSFANAGIKEVLDRCVDGQPFTYVIQQKTITIKLAEQPEKQQELTVTGKVTDDHQLALPGVTIRVKNTNTFAISDKDGNYRIKVPQGNEILLFRYIGYAEQEVPVNNRTQVNVALVPSAAGLEQVVVVAYGMQRKATVTGAIASIQTKEIKQSPAANLAVTLAGRLPGLTAIQRSGEPGRDVTNLFLRGQGTINAQSPIILVDGIERDLTSIDPNEIASVTILKDASSTAMFGVRGANGVILVTTRRGTSTVPEINFSMEGAAQQFTRVIQPVNSAQFAELRNLALQNDGLPYAYSAEAIEKYRSGSDPLRYPNTDWNDILLKKFSYQQRYNLNVSGATPTTSYFINAGFLDQGGQFNTEKDLKYDPRFLLKRYNFRSNIDVKLNKSLKAFLNVAGYLEKRNSPIGVFNYLGGSTDENLERNSPAYWILALANDLNATVPGPLTPDGEVITSPGVTHPAYGQINRSGYIQQTRANITATYGMEQSLDVLTKGLSVKAVASFDARMVNNMFAAKYYEKYVQVIDPNQKGPDGEALVYYRPFNNDKNTPLNIWGGRFFTSLTNFQGYMNYNRQFGKHAVTGLLLYQQQSTRINQELPYNLRGFSSRLTYNFDNRYFVEFNAGYNGSEQFNKGNRFGFFPAVSGGWLISNEKFLVNNSTIHLLKLRASYGEVGNDRIGDRRFLYLDDIQVGGGGYSGSLGNGERVNTNLLRNEQLQWEVAKKANIGIELGLFESLNLTVDLFNEKRNNILRSRGTIPILNGLPSSALPPVNSGIVKNHGYEIELSYRKSLRKDLSVLSRVNLSYATNRQLFADEPLLPDGYAYRYRETGYRIGQPFGYIVERYFQNEADILNSPKQNVGGHESRPGDFKYRDLNNDGVVDVKDQAPIGYAVVPEYTFGAAFNVNYKNFDCSVLLQGVTNASNFYLGRGNFPEQNYSSWHLESWTPERAEKGRKISYPRLSTQGSPNEIGNSAFYLDASYIRLKNVELGYTFSQAISKRVGAKRLRVYLNGLNLYTWDRLPTDNFDPEQTGELTYPITKLYNAGVNFTF